jgi:hypothetical protein
MILGASHGFVKDGLQTLVANKYDVAHDYYELIDVEKGIKEASKKHPNLYSLVHYATCRKAISDLPYYKLVLHDYVGGRGPEDTDAQIEAHIKNAA